MTKKQFYHALSQLKTAGLIQKYGNAYFHTTFGRVVYQSIIELSKCQGHIKEMQIIDSLRHMDGITPSDINDFASQILGALQPNNEENENRDNDKAVAAPSASSDNVFPKIEFFETYEQMLLGLARSIDSVNEEILIATRVSPIT